MDAIASLGMSSNTMDCAIDLNALPSGFLPYREFAQKFSLGSTTTEKLHEKTRTLSQRMQGDVIEGLQMLWDADQAVVEGLERSIPEIQKLAPELAERMKAGGRIFLVGSGSSGRVAVDLAAKCGSGQIRGVIAGGDSAMIRAKEGFEDSEADGEKCLQPFALTAQDTVFLISASGSASFNVGCGHYAANQGAHVHYFYNSQEIPSRTRQLFERVNNPVVPWELDIGPQSISGSTRLQSATLAEACLGSLLGTALLSDPLYAKGLLENMKEGNQRICQHLATIGQFVEKEADVFLSKQANFRRLKDETGRGYVTLVGEKECLREILIDATETSPTFSVNPIRRETETVPKRAEFRAYLAGENNNRAAWEALVGRSVESEAVEQFLLAMGAEGQHAYEKRPRGMGNMMIGVVKQGQAAEVIDALEKVSAQEGEVGMIAVSREAVTIENAPSLSLVLDEVATDPLGLTETILLKQILNMISNGSMVLMGKVHGNRMIDVRAANQKLIDRVMRLVKEIWVEAGRSMPLTDEELYYMIAHLSVLKKKYAEEGIYTPSVVKIALSLLTLQKRWSREEFQEALDFLTTRQERLDFLAPASPPFTFCIDGGGSKTLLQVVDQKGDLVLLKKEGKIVSSVEAGPSNINVVKLEGVKQALRDLFSHLEIGNRKIKDVLKESNVIAGLAGVAIAENHAAVTKAFEEVGIKQLQLLTDAELALKMVQGNGIVLISGTGSICFAEKEGVRQRVGGLGRILGDEGSGYQIALQAIRAALAEEYGYGPSTSLTQALRDFFGVQEIKNLLPKINTLEMSTGMIATASPIVFAKCAEKDPVATAIIAKAAEDLRQMVQTAMKISQLANCELHLWGGVFKGDLTQPIVDAIQKEAKTRNIEVVNHSSENAAVLFARQRTPFISLRPLPKSSKKQE